MTRVVSSRWWLLSGLVAFAGSCANPAGPVLRALVTVPDSGVLALGLYINTLADTAHWVWYSGTAVVHNTGDAPIRLNVSSCTPRVDRFVDGEWKRTFPGLCTLDLTISAIQPGESYTLPFTIGGSAPGPMPAEYPIGFEGAYRVFAYPVDESGTAAEILSNVLTLRAGTELEIRDDSKGDRGTR